MSSNPQSPKHILRIYPDCLRQIKAMRCHRRMKVFAEYGTKCHYCNRVGTKMILHKFKKGDKHIDLFTDDLVLMTIDHIVPKSLGGSNDIGNLRPACCICNAGKDNQSMHDFLNKPREF